MIRWSIWESQHRVELTPEQRSQIFSRWLIRSQGLVRLIQLGCLATAIVLVASVILVAIALVALEEVLGRAIPVGLITVFALVVDLVLLHQIIVGYIAEQMRHEVRRLLQGPPVCANCGYDLRGSLTGICPECGEGRLGKRSDGDAEPPG